MPRTRHTTDGKRTSLDPPAASWVGAPPVPIRGLRDKCLITGAASGIGGATALAAAGQGAAVFLTDIDATSLAQVADQIRRRGGSVGAVPAFDIADVDAVRRFAEAIHTEHGPWTPS